MQNFLNFIQEDTLLQTNDCKMGDIRYHILVDRTPKFHPNISVKVIECSWGCVEDY